MSPVSCVTMTHSLCVSLIKMSSLKLRRSCNILQKQALYRVILRIMLLALLLLIENVVVWLM